MRPLEPGDIPAVANLYERVIRSGGATASPELVSYFERTLLASPWTDAEIPSLVYLDREGRIVGFLGSHVRRLTLGDRSIRLACSGQLVVEPDARHIAAGALLLRKYLAGPQDLTITDGATIRVRRIWDKLAGETAGPTSLNWTRLFRPWRFAVERALLFLALRAQSPDEREGLPPREGGPRSARAVARMLGPLWSLLDGITSLLAGPILRPRKPDTVVEPLTPAAVLEHMAALAPRLRLYPSYDREYLEWLFRELAATRTRGTFVAHLVRGGDGRALGWYVYYLKSGGISQVLQIVAANTEDARAVIRNLFHHARQRGSVALQGRLEPRLMEPLSRQGCILRYGGGALTHSRDPEVLAALASKDTLLTRMEGEWWMEHQL
jgi:hypothetical protein